MSDFRILSGHDPADYDTRRVAVAMSGGIDSSLSAAILKDAGFDIVGVTMHLWDADPCTGAEDGCTGNNAVRDARLVAEDLGIPHHAFDLREEFEQEVVSNFAETYLAGRTPNPCVRCNRYIKWGALRRKAAELGCGLIATGHYARIARFTDSTHALVTGSDPAKEQSYFLWGLGPDDLAATIFPLGNMTKNDTRAATARRGMRTVHRAESQEICFIPHNDYGRFLLNRAAGYTAQSLTPGDILDTSGRVIGEHPGAAFFTIGQRRGLGIALGQPAYVVAVDTAANTVTVGCADDLLAESLTTSSMVWSRGGPLGESFRCDVRIRYRHKGAPATVTVTDTGAEVRFDTPERAITPGQSAVFYREGMVLGGG